MGGFNELSQVKPLGQCLEHSKHYLRGSYEPYGHRQECTLASHGL